MQERRFSIALAAGDMAGLAWGADDQPLDIVFLHANGFCASTYRSLLAPLAADRPRPAHVAALDLRGHGRTRLPADPARQRSWNQHRDDVIAALDQIAPAGAILSGHSMGATTALLVAAARPDLVKRLVLVDPVLQPKEFYAYAHMPWTFPLWRRGSAMAKAALRRRARFDSREAAREAYAGRGPFANWRAPFIQDYLDDGLTPDGDGFRLSCAPEWEAACYAGQQHRPWKAMREARAPTAILRAARGSTCDLEAADYAEQTLRAKVTGVPGASHFIAMERPYVVADALRAARAGLDPTTALLG